MQLEQSTTANITQKQNTAAKKDSITNIDWSMNSQRIVVCFKIQQIIAVWDVVTC